MKVSISNKVVKKHFSPYKPSHFHNEIFWLKKLKNFGIVPKVIDIDYKNFVISLSNEGEIISTDNKPKNWEKQLSKILDYLKKNNCFHSDISQENILVKNNKLTLIDFAQSTKITDLKKNVFLKNRILFDQYSLNRINLSINKNVICSNNLRVLVIWDPTKVNQVEKSINQNKNISIIDKTKIIKSIYRTKFKDRIYWLDQFYNKKISKDTNKLKNDIYVYVIESINPVFKLNKMMFVNEKKIVDDKIFKFKKKIRKKRTSIIHISYNFEESKRNAIFFSSSKKNYPAKYFFKSQTVFDNKKDFFLRLNKSRKLKYVVLRKQISEKDDIDILVNDYFLFKRISDCHSYKLKDLNFISNSGDPIDEGGFKVANYIRIKDEVVKLDVRFIGDGYMDQNWQKTILKNRKLVGFQYIPDDEDLKFSLIYHIVYHKGRIADKYKDYLKKNFKLEKIKLEYLKEKINSFMSSKQYKFERPSDLTMPITFKIDELFFKDELKFVKNQIENRNFSGANKMILNIYKYQSFLKFFNYKLNFLIFLNQFNLVKSKFKIFFFKYICLNK